MHRSATWTAGLAVTAVTATFLVTGGGPASITPRAAAATGLEAFDDCDQLAEWYRATALEEVTAYGLGGYGVDLLVAETAAFDDTAARDQSAVANGDTGTNVQEAGVDEPDVAKTDGTHTYVVDGRHLVVTDVTGDEPREVGRLKLPSGLRGAELLLVGDRVVLLATGWAGGWGGRIAVDSIYPGGSGRALMTVVDVSDPAAMSITEQRAVEGSLVAAREHDGTVRVVVASHPTLDFVRPGPRWDLPRWQRRQADELTSREALRENRRIVREADAQAFLPQQRVDGGAEQPLLDCGDVTHPEDASGLGTISVLTVDPSAPADLETTGISASGDQVYASTDRLYVATYAGGWWSWADDDGSRETTTEVHTFDVGGSSTSYVASGEVPGYAPDRWSFSEHEGRLRVATTEQRGWRDVASTVTVLEEQAGSLEPVGSVGGLGRGEQIQSVRWFDDLAIVVTFRQVDPLYTVDLTDPTAPAVLGELKIPGFSAYLHPVGDDLVLGVGQDATGRGLTTGSQVSSFDLSDLADPARVTALGLGQDRYSPVEDDARAFTYLPEQGLALVPLDDWRRGGTRVAAVRVGADGTLTHAGSLEVRGDTYGLRALPLPDGRVAVVSGGTVQLVDPATWAQASGR
jgi:uncharacterized secreted protein with C-terminal beta-propeller domain